MKSFLFNHLILAISILTVLSTVDAQNTGEPQAATIKVKKQPVASSPISGLGNSASVLRPAAMDSDSLPPTTVDWSEEIFDFGEIKQGEKVSHTFQFTNTGNHPLKLSNVKPSCGCTSPNWSKELIQPGEEGVIEVVFDSAGKLGAQMKSITVFLNTTELRKVLRFKGYISE